MISGTWGALPTDARLKVLNEAVSVARDAGSLLLNYLVDPMLKDQRALADLEAERLIRERLSQRFATWGFRAEEEPEHNRIVDDHLPFWLIDPNDGTSAFLKGERGASVSIALISSGQPVLGVIFAYAAPNNKGDLFTWAEGCGPLKRNGHSIEPRWISSWSEAICFISNSADNIASAYQKTLCTSEGEARYRVAPGIAYRLALCAAGEGEVAISLASPRDFDLAAGHALIIGAGGVLLDERGQEMSYNHHRPHRLGFAFAGAPNHVAYAAGIDWRLTFEAQRTPATPPFLSPLEVTLCTQEQALDAFQGAWWGWHIGTLIQRIEDSGRSLDAQRTQEELIITLIREISPNERFGDLRLVTEARALCKGHAKLKDLPQLQCFLSTHSEVSQNTHVEPQSAYPANPQEGLRWGLSLGRRDIPSRIISDLLSWRVEQMDTWQPDADRLSEQLSTLLGLSS